jgi:nephrocystin-3
MVGTFPAMPVSNELRLFLSSTFIDFHGERDFLSKKVFPSLRRLCRERGVEFTEIDLRWGLTDEDAEQGRILGTCFEEIDQCRPFFIGLLGERYGWVPPVAEFEKNPELRTEYPWLEAALHAGQSATEMEFRHGFLNPGSGDTKPLIYFRSAADATQEDPRITSLKAEVSDRLGAVPEFHSPSDLATLIERDLTALIELHWPASEKKSWIEEERAGHAAFAQSRRKGYVPNLSLIDTLNAHLERSQSVLILTGESGSGKSSLLSYWAETLRNRSGVSEPFIIEHFVGVTAASTDPDTLMRRIVSEIRERIHSGEPIPQSAAELAQSFPSWLGRISEEPLLIIVDAINQFNTEGRFLSWLPDHVSANLKWVISSTESEALQRLRSRGLAIVQTWPEVPVNPITLHERQRVLRTFLAGFQKKLHPTQEEKIVHDEKSSNPLFLRTLLEELRLQGKHEELDHLIEHYLSSSDIPDLFKRILERLEYDYGSENVRTLLTRIWAAPYGLSESELLGSSELDRASLSHLLHALDYHLIRLKGRLSFFHDHLRAGVEGRYLDTPPDKQQAWLELASYFEQTDASAIKALSLPWLLRRAEHWQQLERSLLDVALMPYLTEGSRSYDLLGYWLELEKRMATTHDHTGPKQETDSHPLWNIDVVGEYESALSASTSAIDPMQEREIRYALALFFHNAKWLQGAISNATKALALASEDPNAASRTLDLYVELGTAYLDDGNSKDAALCLETAMELLGNGDSSVDHREITVRNEYARLLMDQGKYPEAETVVRATLQKATERFGPRDPNAQHAMRLLADILGLQAKYKEAEALHRAALMSIESSLGPESMEAGYYLNQLANFHRRFGGNYQESQQLFERAIKIIENRLGEKHPDLAILLANFASLHSQNGHWEKADPLFLRSLAISEVAHGPEHPETATSLNNYAGLLYRQQKYDEAEKPYRRALAIRCKALGEDHPVTASSFNNLGNLLRRQGDYREAERCYAQALKIRMATIGPLHEDTGRTLESFGSLMRIKGELSLAEDYLIRSYDARKASLDPQHYDRAYVAIELAEVLLERSKASNAQEIMNDLLNGVKSKEVLPDDLRSRFDVIARKLETFSP